ncbi:endonuclease/exonuclease/phosphatase family protein [Candidatus Roizmanbacteria bacterium]|nr:endonuclease/exonuclease/phosphatase family protein [Candidatus Roizmanbacteria bacterium]
MTISLLTYNLLFNKALTSVPELIEQYKPDLICFQEMKTTEEEFTALESFGYELADFSNSFIKHGTVYGIGTFYNKNIFKFKSARTLTLPRSYYEWLLLFLRGGNNPRTVLKTELLVRDTSTQITLYNLHLSPYSTNGIRVKQFIQTLDDISHDTTDHLLLAGDFNYPYGRKKFEELIHAHDLQEATSSIFYTLEQRFLKFFSIRWKLDYVLYKGLKLIKTERIPVRASDHYPILSSFEI